VKISGWILTKTDAHPDGNRHPIAASMSVAWQGPMQPLHPDGWMLLQVRCHGAHHRYMKHDDDIIWIGNEWSKVPPELLEAYAEKLDPNETYSNLGQVLDKLGEWDARFLERLPPK
jgi:hypothetical protein